MSIRLNKQTATVWWEKFKWYRRQDFPWNRLRLEIELAKRQAFARGRMNGDVLGGLLRGQITIGEHCFFESDVWLSIGDDARISLGDGVFLNQGVMVASSDLVQIGDHGMIANGCLITDGNHRFDDPNLPVPWQGFTSKGPVIIGDNVWLGANVVVTSGVTIGERCVVGANSVVTTDLPPFSIAAGVPAKVIKTIEYESRISGNA